jgi:hypothetical protein
MEYLSEIIWYSTWPIVIFIAVKFVILNLSYYTKMERLEELEEYYIQNEAHKKA